MRNRRIGVALILGALSIGAAIGCSGDDGPSVAPTGSQTQLGSISMPLRGQVDGITYRLRDAVFSISGPQAASLDSEADPDASVLSVQLPGGGYSIDLQDGWRLERLDGMNFVTVQATLISPDPAGAQVLASATTRVSFVFSTDDGIITLEPGVLEIGIEVQRNGGGGNACMSDADCGGAVESCRFGQCASVLTRFSEGSSRWPDQACNPTNSFGGCDTNAQDHADAWATFVCQQNGWVSGVWTGNKLAGCAGEISMFCLGTIPCSPLVENFCQQTDQTIVEFSCFR